MSLSPFRLRISPIDQDRKQVLYDLLHVYKVEHHLGSEFAALSAIIAEWQSLMDRPHAATDGRVSSAGTRTHEQ